MRGYIHLYCGDGKGKTTAAMGLTMRALGSQMKVLVVQFMKSTPSAELVSLEKLGVVVHRGKVGKGFFPHMSDEEKEKSLSNQNDLLDLIIESMNSCDFIVMDEVISACNYGLVDVDKVKFIIENKPKSVELVLTGRNPLDFMVDNADYYTEMKKIKHPYDHGILAREGIEY